MAQPVVARYQDGRILKGTSMDISPSRPTFHIRPPDGPMAEVSLSELKALFFVRTLEGNPAHQESRALDPTDIRARGNALVRITFHDGEVLVGLTIRFPPIQPFFYVIPVDATSNNLRILVNRAATVSMEALESPTPQ